MNFWRSVDIDHIEDFRMGEVLGRKLQMNKLASLKNKVKIKYQSQKINPNLNNKSAHLYK